MINLYFIAGTKGGVGKSTFAAMLADVSTDLNFETHLFDCDNENLSLSNSVSGIKAISTKKINPDNNADYPLDKVVNDVVSIAEKKENKNVAFIVDMKAGTTDFVHNWFKRVPLKELKNEFGINIFIVGSITSDPDSVYTFGKWVKYFEEHKKVVTIVAVKNLKEGSDFAYYIKRLQPAIQNLPGKEIDFIKISNNYLLEIKDSKTTLGQVAKGEKTLPLLNQFMDLRRIKSYYEDVAKNVKCLFEN